MTPAEDLAVVRARLERIVALGEATEQDLVDEGVPIAEAAFVAGVGSDLLLRVAREALGVLDRHGADCIDCGVFDRCPEVASVLRAWQP